MTIGAAHVCAQVFNYPSVRVDPDVDVLGDYPARRCRSRHGAFEYGEPEINPFFNVGMDRDHDRHVAYFDQFAPHLRFRPARARGLRGHHETRATSPNQVAVKIRNPQIIAVGYGSLFIDPGQTEWQARIVLDFLGPRHRH